jgi:uncharacterized protein (UPF0333 family)
VTETGGDRTVIVERRGGGGFAVLIGVILLVAVAVGAVYLFNQSQNDAIRTDAVQDAAAKVGTAAEKAGDAVTGETK